MEKKVKKVVITSIATVAGVFGGMKLYANKKKEKRLLKEQKTQERKSSNL